MDNRKIWQLILIPLIIFFTVCCRPKVHTIKVKCNFSDSTLLVLDTNYIVERFYIKNNYGVVLYDVEIMPKAKKVRIFASNTTFKTSGGKLIIENDTTLKKRMCAIVYGLTSKKSFLVAADFSYGKDTVIYLESDKKPYY